MGEIIEFGKAKETEDQFRQLVDAEIHFTLEKEAGSCEVWGDYDATDDEVAAVFIMVKLIDVISRITDDAVERRCIIDALLELADEHIGGKEE